jgi:hypothetical protein
LRLLRDSGALLLLLLLQCRGGRVLLLLLLLLLRRRRRPNALLCRGGRERRWRAGPGRRRRAWHRSEGRGSKRGAKEAAQRPHSQASASALDARQLRAGRGVRKGPRSRVGGGRGGFGGVAVVAQALLG